MTTITHGAGVITPTIVDGYSARRTANTVVHDILNRSNPDVSLRAFGLRSGALTLVFADQTTALDAYAVLSVPQVLSIMDPDVESIGMSFVVADGDLEIALDEETRSVYVVTVPFREVIV